MIATAVAQRCRTAGSARELQLAVIEALRPAVPFDAHVFVLTDPATSVGTSPLADGPDLARLPELIGCKYLTAANRWTALTGPAGRPDLDTPWRRLLRDLGVDDVLSAVFRDAFGCWAFLDLWRRAGRFTPAEAATVASVRDAVTEGLRRCHAASLRIPRRTVPPSGPLVVTLTDDLRIVGQTGYATEVLDALLPADGGRATVPAAAYNVGAQLRAVEAGVDPNPASARVWLTDGVWLTLRAARFGADAIAVGIEETAGADRIDLYARAFGLSPRERELIVKLVAGADTRALARQLGVSAHTVQDHLKSIFAKCATRSRHELVTQVLGG
jgi:DNA-binding CsgD family transcriptional regulator